jgi:hypothetical protein
MWNTAHMEKIRNAYRALIGSLEGNRPIGRLVRKLEDNIKIDYEVE